MDTIHAVSLSVPSSSLAAKETSKEGIGRLVEAYNAVLKIINQGAAESLKINDDLNIMQNTQQENLKDVLDEKIKVMEKMQTVSKWIQGLLIPVAVLAGIASFGGLAAVAGGIAAMTGIFSSQAISLTFGAIEVGTGMAGGALQIYKGSLAGKLSEVQATTTHIGGNTQETEQLVQYAQDNASTALGVQASGNKTMLADLAGLAAAMQRAAQFAALGLNNK
ncbi:MAG: hypothetical protein JW769_01110 [Parachlamydiales bacterium]|nr:hypothetical protein [Parachlamydiales bacterium]